MQTPEEERLWNMAQKRVAFRKHFFVYALVNIFLIILWYFTTSTQEMSSIKNWWFIYPLFGWGIGIVFHYWGAYHDDDSSISKEYKRLKNRRDNRNAEPADKTDTTDTTTPKI